MATTSDIKKFKLEEINIRDDFGAEASLASVVAPANSQQMQVLVEWLEYDLQWVGTAGQELFLRVEAIAALLHRTPKPSGFRCLDCTGYFHEARRHSFGLVFALPGTSKESPKTLKSLIRQLRPREKRLNLPFLGDVFTLARTLASSVLEFHKAGWFHKNISSLNIIFFPEMGSSSRVSVTQPYLIGFRHSRPDQPDAFTHGPDHNPEQRDYSHPEYLKDESRFQCKYDYYSLGLVLLEIGLWKTLGSISSAMQGDDQSPESLRLFLIRNHVPLLGNSMGEVYQQVVLKCLESNIVSTEDVMTEVASTLAAFEDNVLIPLRTCCA